MNSPWPLPMLFVGWGTSSQGGWGGSISSLVEKFPEVPNSGKGKVLGPKTICLQISQCEEKHVKELKERNYKVVGWDDAHAVNATNYKKGFDGYMPQIETPEQYDAAVSSIKNGIGKDHPLSVITTYWGLYDPTNDTTIRSGSKWKALENLGVSACYVECYKADDPTHADIQRMLNQGVIYGIPKEKLIPVAGAYRNEMPSDYIGLEGRNWGLWIAELISYQQCEVWGKFNLVTKVWYWRVKSGTNTLFSVRAKTFPDHSTGYSRMIDWLGQNRNVLASIKSVEIRYELDVP